MRLSRRSDKTAADAGKQQNTELAADLARFGQHIYDSVVKPWPTVWKDFVGPMQERYRADQDGFLTILADVAEKLGGWVAYGAERLMVEVAGGDLQHPAYGRMMDASVAFLRSSGVPPMKVIGYEWQHWISSAGTSEDWIPRRPTPHQGEVPISELGIGEPRRLAQLTAADDSNLFLVERTGSSSYSWVVEAAYSDDDPRRTRWVQMTAESLHDVYVRIGLSLQVPPYWCDSELEPYIPTAGPAL